MKNILVPTDFSENSWNAIIYALSFFKKIRCNFYFLHVSPFEEVIQEDALYVTKSITGQGKKQMQQLFQKIEKLSLHPQHQFFPVLEHVFFIDAIRKQVKEREIDYIVMGTKGASGLKERTIGSNTGDVITRVKCPVLVIPEHAKYVKPVEVAFPTDYNLHYKSKVLSTMAGIVAMNNALLHVLHISKKEKELSVLQKRNKDFLQNYLEDRIDHSFCFLSNPNLEEAIQCFVESRDIDMITMIAKNVNFFQRILFRPTVEKISYHTHIPFLVLHE